MIKLSDGIYRDVRTSKEKKIDSIAVSIMFMKWSEVNDTMLNIDGTDPPSWSAADTLSVK